MSLTTNYQKQRAQKDFFIHVKLLNKCHLETERHHLLFLYYAVSLRSVFPLSASLVQNKRLSKRKDSPERLHEAGVGHQKKNIR